MQKTTLVLTLILISFLSFSCKKEKTAPNTKFSFENKSAVINWVAFKTTDKIPVKGTFKTIDIVNAKVTTDKIEAINDLEFRIPVNSIDTKDKDRDAKIIKDFFGTMKDTQYLTGKVNLNKNGNGTIKLIMNGISKDLPVTYITSGQTININTTLNLDNWQAQAAINALNLVCNEKHKGEDGISKTWNEVVISIVIYLKAE